MLETAVAFFVFNRPATTRQVWQRIRAVQPRQLFVVADGPRPDRPGEDALCLEVRQLIANGVDWPCDVQTNYSDVNLGCGTRVASGLDWVFREVPEAIVLEDDCLPDPTFFRFCAELLERYRDEPRVGLISGCNFRGPRSTAPESYFFSAYNFIWGWAAWRRSWSVFDRSMTRWPALRDSAWLRDWLQSRPAAAYWRERFDAMHAGRVDTWDYPWTFSLWANQVLSILPAANLVTNLGFGPNATHSPPADQRLGIPATPMSFPLHHPAAVVRDIESDKFFEREVFRIGWKHVLKQWLKRPN